MRIHLSDITADLFEAQSLEIFHHQYEHVSIYKEYCDGIRMKPSQVKEMKDIPFLPIQFFKTHKVFGREYRSNHYFQSSGTSEMILSHHYLQSFDLYHSSLESGFQFYFSNTKYTIVGLLPHYMERPHSSLIHMVKFWMEKNRQKELFYLNNLEQLSKDISERIKNDEHVLLIGISFALLDLANKYTIDSNRLTIIETGGMKGTRREILKSELFDRLRLSFPNARIISEYGMCELLSQAYSDENMLFSCPPWMKMFIGELQDPITTNLSGQGRAKIIDLANQESCAFIETEDLILLHPNGKFQLLGRADTADIRGCSLLLS